MKLTVEATSLIRMQMNLDSILAIIRLNIKYLRFTNSSRLLKKFIQRIMLIFLTITGTYVQAQTNLYLKSVKASIQGKSTLHNWKSEITKIEYKGFLQTEGTIKTIKNVEVKIPVEGIKSKEGKKMDRKIYEAFKSDKNLFIIFSCNSAEIRIDTMNIVTIEASGNITMAGTTRPIFLMVKGKVLADGTLQLSISQKMKMTEFKMEPPTAMLGTIRAEDEVIVNFDMLLTYAKNINN
jgi:hypothetical protein